MAIDEKDSATDHGGLAVLRVEDCEELLRTHQIGRVAFLTEGEPVILPVNYLYRQGRLVFQSAPGAKLEAAAHARRVAFEIDGWNEADQSGWSVLVQGLAEHIVDRATIEEFEGMGLRPWAPAAERGEWVAILPLRDLRSAGGLKPGIWEEATIYSHCGQEGKRVRVLRPAGGAGRP